MFLVYNLLITILSPLWVPWMLFRASRRKEAPNWKERQGNYDLKPNKDRPRAWVHAVSVGEVMASLPILKQLKALRPDLEVVLSVTTSSGHHTAREHAVDLYDHLVYFPIDVPRFQLAAMSRVRPAIVAVMETELWFNFLWAAKAFGAKTLLINGRISDRSFRRSKYVRFFYAALLKFMDRCLMQTEGDAERIKALGGQNVDVFGNSKFDQAIDGLDAKPNEWKLLLGLPDDVPIVVIGSTRGEDEEKFVLDALEQVGIDKIAVVHAPRHLERVPDLEKEARSRFGEVSLRSSGEGGRYIILDSYGELAKVYAVADLVIIGGGFANFGGQNLLQPLAHGKPVLHGPYMQNFKEVAKAAQEIGASIVCSTPGELGATVAALLQDPDKRASMGEAGKAFVRANEGASRRYAEAIAKAVD